MKEIMYYILMGVDVAIIVNVVVSIFRERKRRKRRNAELLRSRIENRPYYGDGWLREEMERLDRMTLGR